MKLKLFFSSFFLKATKKQIFLYCFSVTVFSVLTFNFIEAMNLSSPKYSFETVKTYTVEITSKSNSTDFVDIYYPFSSSITKIKYPVGLFLQGALLDKSNYSTYASSLARYGLIVIIPNHVRDLFNPKTSKKITGYYPETAQVENILDFLSKENYDKDSPIYNLLDLDKLVLLGHSFGGSVGLSVINNSCLPIVCTEDFTRSEAIVAGVFFGTNFKDNSNNTFRELNNDLIPTALIQGDLDGISSFEMAEGTYKSIQNPPKGLIIVKGMNHYGIVNQDNLRDSNRPTLEQKTGIETIAYWTYLFLKATVFDDVEAQKVIFYSNQNVDKNITVISER